MDDKLVEEIGSLYYNESRVPCITRVLARRRKMICTTMAHVKHRRDIMNCFLNCMLEDPNPLIKGINQCPSKLSARDGSRKVKRQSASKGRLQHPECSANLFQSITYPLSACHTDSYFTGHDRTVIYLHRWFRDIELGHHNVIRRAKSVAAYPYKLSFDIAMYSSVIVVPTKSSLRRHMW